MDPLKSTAQIIVADDEKEICNIIADCFETTGIKILKAHSGNQAIAMLSENPVDLIITDTKMPDGNGIELIKKVKEFKKQLPIFLLLTDFNYLSVEEAYDLGADAIFSKPLSLKRLCYTAMQSLKNCEEKWSMIPLGLKIDYTIKRNFVSFEAAQNNNELDIARGGFFIADPYSNYNIDSYINFEITFETGEISQLKGVGIVRWLRKNETQFQKPGMGIEFFYVEKANRNQLATLVKARNTQAYIPR